MGKVSEYGDMGNDINVVNPYGGITLKDEQIGQHADLILSAVPTTYEIFINDDLVYSCRTYENAKLIYNAILSDAKGKDCKNA